jgi:hypothetical protein
MLREAQQQEQGHGQGLAIMTMILRTKGWNEYRQDTSVADLHPSAGLGITRHDRRLLLNRPPEATLLSLGVVAL